jgi:methyl-accepting chemotaxis protein
MGSLVAAIEGNVNVAKLIGNASQEQMVRIDSMRGQLEELLGTMSENAYKVHATSVISQVLYHLYQFAQYHGAIPVRPSAEALPVENENRKMPRL